MISKQGRIPEKQALRIFRDIVAACSFLYDRNIFHRDLKPENILLSNGIAKISDFGFAKAIEEAEKKDNPTVQTSIGTPFYMSPEILNNEPYSIKCDVWSLGVTIYKMLYGMCPWSAHNLLELVKMVKKKV
jgi:serine/threonine protein kinase